MKTGRPKAALALTAEELAQLQGLLASRSMPQGIAARARIILLSHAGRSNTAIADKLGMTKATVGKWRQRFLQDRVAGLHDELRQGRPRSRADEDLAALLTKTLRTKPSGSTQWSCRTMQDATGIPKSTVHRVWQAFGLQPHRQRTFKLSTDPFFVEKVRDIVGLYLNPPDKALVLCVDEKTQVQALNRTQPVLPMGLGYVEGVTHDYVRHGTTTLFAALDVATGTVISQCRRRHRHQEFLAFLRHLDASVPRDLDIHLIIATMPPTNIPRSGPGSRCTPAIRSTTHRRTPPGSIKSNSGSDESLSRRSVADPSRALRNWSPRSITLCGRTTRPPDPLRGPRPQTQSWRSSADFANVFLGQYTRRR